MAHRFILPASEAVLKSTFQFLLLLQDISARKSWESGSPNIDPNSRALMTRTPTKGTPQCLEQPYGYLVPGKGKLWTRTLRQPAACSAGWV